MESSGIDSTWVKLFSRNIRESVPLGYVMRPDPFTRIDTGQAFSATVCGARLLVILSVDEGGPVRVVRSLTELSDSAGDSLI